MTGDGGGAACRERQQDVPGQAGARQRVARARPRRGPRPRRRQRVGQVDADQDPRRRLHRRLRAGHGPGRQRRSRRRRRLVARLGAHGRPALRPPGPRDLPAAQRGRNIAIGRGFPTHGPVGRSASASCAVERRRSSIATASTCARPTCSRTSARRSARWSPSRARSRTRTSTRAACSSSTSRRRRCPSPRSTRCSTALRIFARSGQSILFVSHRTPEVLGFADRVTVLRDGTKVATVDGEGLTEERIVELIVGRKLETLERDHPTSAPARRTRSCTRATSTARVSTGVTMDLREGEVLGIAGLVGCGRSELLKVSVRRLQARQRGDPARRPADPLRHRARGDAQAASPTSPRTVRPRRRSPT